MIHIFNRQELVVAFSQQQLYRLQSALHAAGIPFRTRFNRSFLTADRSRGIPGIDHNATELTTIYVKKADYHRAQTVIGPILRDC